METTTRMSATEFLQLPETTQPTELLNGEVIMSPAPVPQHQRVSFRLAKYLDRIKPDGEVWTAPIDLYFDDDNVAQPDILWAAADSACVEEDKYLKGSPELIVEIHSPSTRRYDIREKYNLYEAYGVQEYWMVDTDAPYVSVHTLQNGEYKRLDVFVKDDVFDSPVLKKQVEVIKIFED